MAAQLRVKIDRKRGVATPANVVRLAQARKATPAEQRQFRAVRATG